MRRSAMLGARDWLLAGSVGTQQPTDLGLGLRYDLHPAIRATLFTHASDRPRRG